MEIGLDEIVVGGVVGKLPCAHAVQLVGVALLQDEVVARVDVDEDVAGLVSSVVLHAVLDAVRGEGFVERHVKVEVGTLRDVFFHREIAAACKAALNGRAEIVGLVEGKAVFELALAVDNGFGLRLYAREVDVVAEFDVELEISLFGHRNCDHVGLGDGAADVDAAGERCRFVKVYIALGLVRIRGNEGNVEAVAVEGEDSLAAGCRAFAQGDYLLHAFAAEYLDVDVVVGAIDPVVIVLVAVGGVDGVGEHRYLLDICRVAHLDLDCAGYVVLCTFGGEDITAGSDVEIIFYAVGRAGFDCGAGGLIDQRHCRRSAVHFYLYGVGLGRQNGADSQHYC